MKKQLGQGAPPAFATAMTGFPQQTAPNGFGAECMSTHREGVVGVTAKGQSGSAKVTNV